MTVVIDTNVLISAALRDRLPEQVILFVVGRDEAILTRWTELLGLRTVNVGSPPTATDYPRDPKDAPFLAAALASRADFLITGDNDLIAAQPMIAMRIVTVAQFAAEFKI